MNQEDNNSSINIPPINENTFSIPQEDHKFSFHGKGKDYLLLSLYNLFLTFITLGIYYPWAKCAIRKFLWQETEVNGSRFEWHGTGKEMFKGFIKAYLILGALFAILKFGPMFIPFEYLPYAIMTAYVLIIALIPIAIHGMMKYRLSRTSLRGIHFGYRGELKKFYKRFTIDFFLTIITLGIYGAWLQINARKYVMKHSRYGNVSAEFNATGWEFFKFMLGQMLLVLITVYIYLPWAMVKIFKFHLEKTSVIQDGVNHELKSDATGGRFFWVVIKGFLLSAITLGIANPIAELWRNKYFIESIKLSGDFDFDKIQQTEKSYKDATGDDMADALDFDF